MSDSLRIRAGLATAGFAILLLAVWLRSPSIPYAGDWGRARESSAMRGQAIEDTRRRAKAIESIRAAIKETERQLRHSSSRALRAPPSQSEAFKYLRELPPGAESGVVLFEGGVPFAWAGKFRTDPRTAIGGVAAVFSPFYTTLTVSSTTATRRAVAVALIHAEPPADHLSRPLDASVDGRNEVESFAFGVAADEAAGELVRDSAGTPLLRVEATPVPPETVLFNRASRLQAVGSLLLGAVLILFLAFTWTDRRRLGRRLFSLAISVAVIGLIPWNNFSNTTRAFDPAYFFLREGGPFTASAGAFLMLSIAAVLAAFALIRARRANLSRALCAVASAILGTTGLLATIHASRGLAMPPAGATVSLWLMWEVPLFLLLFAFWLLAWWMAQSARGRTATVHLRAASVIALLAGATAVALVWRTTTAQRLEMADRDIGGLRRADGDAASLLRRFGDELTSFDSAGGRPDLLKRYAASDLAPAELQVSLATWTNSAQRSSRLDVAPLAYDTVAVAGVVMQALRTRLPVISPTLGPTGRQVILAAPHSGGSVTTVVVSPRTRLVARDPFSSLLGFAPPVQNDAPYSLTADEVAAPAALEDSALRWRRIGDEWHGDQLIETSRGPIRAHAEVDLRSEPTRLVRGSLVAILNVAIVGLLWALGAIAEGGFVRWVRGKAWKWAQSYRGRLTIALLMFFVVPALTFAAWSYQRLRSDDRDVRELLVRETLSAAAASSGGLANAENAMTTPLFFYSDGMLQGSSDPLYAELAPAGRALPAPVYSSVVSEGELTATWQQVIGGEQSLWGYRAGIDAGKRQYVVAAPSRSDELVLDRRRRDLTMLVLFATAAGGLAAIWLSGIAAKLLARDLELSRIEVARAERVLAWGEMARQVAHEIKNPLTPIRLGVQHLRRARLDGRVDFDRILNENVTRILSEIDRLDEIARAFTRYGSAPADLPAPEPVDVAAILRDVVGLERIGIGDVSWSLQGAGEAAIANARADELREVLLNVFENARLAHARNVNVALERSAKSVCVQISDDGTGISKASLPRVFEPHFSTRTTGSGLGLAISRRLLESWGATIAIGSEEGAGTRVTITLQAVAA